MKMYKTIEGYFRCPVCGLRSQEKLNESKYFQKSKKDGKIFEDYFRKRKNG